MAKQHHPPGNGKSGTLVAKATDTDGIADAGDVTSVTVTGDGVNAMVASWHAPTCQTTGAAGTQLRLQIYDGAGGTGTKYGGQNQNNSDASYSQNNNGFARIPAFSGSKTLYLYLSSSSGTESITAAANEPVELQVRWE